MTPFHQIQARILSIMSALGRPVLASELEFWLGLPLRADLDWLRTHGHIEAAFPEAADDESGRQFWQLKSVAA